MKLGEISAMNQWSYDEHKQYKTELLRRADVARVASDAAVPDHTGVTPHPVAAWVGEKLIQIGERLSTAPAQNENSNYVFADNAR
jgi:hypothetical protein